MARRLVRIYLDTDDEGYARFVNDLWARLPDEELEVVLDSKASLDRANEDYRERYIKAPKWAAGDVAESEEEAQHFLTSPTDRRRRPPTRR
jgi:hypothetical protein